MLSMQLVIGLKECDPLWLILYVLLIKYTVVFLDTLILFVFQSRSHFDLCQLKMADGQQINHQTYLNILEMICLPINQPRFWTLYL